MSPAFPVVVHHNPRCGTSRKVVALVEAAGLAPVLVDYLSAGWSEGQLRALLAVMGAQPRDILRVKEPGAAALGPGASEAALITAMVADPVLVERPIVASPKGVRLCRPAERVADLLP